MSGDGLAWQEVADPPLGPGRVLIRAHAAGVNRADLAQRAGHYPPPPGASELLGLECAGEVEAVGPGVDAWRPGDRVCALLSGGGYAERVVAPATHLLPIPDGLSFTQAAALPEALATAFLNLWVEGGLAPGQRVLLHAGGSGVGTAAIQLCAAFGNPCFATAGSDEKIARCVALGAQGGANRHAPDYAARVSTWAREAGFDLVLDPVGGPSLDLNLRVLTTGGRLVIIGLLGGRTGELDLGRLLVKRLRVIGSVLRSRSDDEKAALVARVRAEVWPLVASGRVQPIVERVFDAREAEQAHALLASNQTFGKVILELR